MYAACAPSLAAKPPRRRRCALIYPRLLRAVPSSPDKPRVDSQGSESHATPHAPRRARTRDQSSPQVAPLPNAPSTRSVDNGLTGSSIMLFLLLPAIAVPSRTGELNERADRRVSLISPPSRSPPDLHLTCPL